MLKIGRQEINWCARHGARSRSRSDERDHVDVRHVPEVVSEIAGALHEECLGRLISGTSRFAKRAPLVNRNIDCVFVPPRQILIPDV
jgi:hypothetical protein